tara:strand:+ start:119047 stop:120141 length:1095 start_codon:yes stop_codon:yes gene_type:complete
MTMAVIAVWDLQDISFTGTPFHSNATADLSDVGTSFVIGSGPQHLEVTDDEGIFEDADSSQDLTNSTTLGGTTFAAGTEVENEYSYIVRPVGGATDGSEDVTIYAFEVSGDVLGMASDGYLTPGVTYEIIARDSSDPQVAYADMFVCFGAGMRIQTPDGPRRVETLRVGDRVMTRDHGPRPILWRGASVVPGRGSQAAICFGPQARLALGASAGGELPDGGLITSPHHRMFWTDADLGPRLVPAKAFVGWKDVRRLPRARQTYVHLLLERHVLVRAEGIWCESFNPGPQALRQLSPNQRAEVMTLCPEARDSRAFRDLFPVERVGPFRRRLGLAPLRLHAGAERSVHRPEGTQKQAPHDARPVV